MTHYPTEREIQAVQEQLGLERMQAYYPVQGRIRAQELAEQQRRRRLAESIDRWARPERDGSLG